MNNYPEHDVIREKYDLEEFLNLFYKSPYGETIYFAEDDGEYRMYTLGCNTWPSDKVHIIASLRVPGGGNVDTSDLFGDVYTYDSESDTHSDDNGHIFKTWDECVSAAIETGSFYWEDYFEEMWIESRDA